MIPSPLTASQQGAVERVGQDVCVIAGPGSGKTRVLIERFAWLVEQRGIEPCRILAITFTEKAAAEIQQRLLARFAARPQLRESIERAWVSTIDGFCARLLRDNAIAAGLAPDFAVMDEAAAQRLARESADQALEEIFQARPAEMRRLLEALDLSTQEDGRNPDLARGLLEVYEAMRVAGVRELASPAPIDMRPQVAELAQQILMDGLASGKAVPQAREWAEKFLALPPGLSRDSFVLLGQISEVNRGSIGKSGVTREAVRRLKDERAPLLEQQWVAEWNAGLLDLLRASISRIDAIYRKKKRGEGLLDFSDLEEEAIRLLEGNAEVRERTAARFDEVLMDELQDTNRLQWRLLKLIRRRLFAVGDVNQSIYGFRHAEPAVFENYREEVIRAGGEIDDLRENHRSFDPILDAVSRVLDRAAGIEARPLTGRRGDGPAIERLVGRGEHAREVEASLVAARIAELRTQGRDYREIAILTRTMPAAAPIESALDCAGIPFLVTSGRTFLEAREIRDLMALLAALANPLDEISLVGVLRGPLAGIGDEEIFRMGREGWRAEFERRFGRLRARAAFDPPDLLLASALDQSGYTAALPERAQANVDKFLGRLRREPRGRPLARILEDLESLRALQSEAEAPPPDAADAVRLMSVHAAKGLEFPVVFLSALHHGADRRKPVIAFSAGEGLGAKWRNPATGKGVSDTAHARIIAELKRQEEAEENRLLYVAMTRARDLLILSHAERRSAQNWQKRVEAAIPVTRAADRVEKVAPAVAVGLPAAKDRFVDKPAVYGQFDSSVAATAVAAFRSCPRKYLLASIARPSAVEGGAMTLGLEVHRVLAGGAGSPEARALAERFAVSELGRRAARASRIEREFDFLIPVGELVVRGQIDLWFEEGGELIVVDYKTDREEAPGEAYAVQLALYALALEKYAGRPPDRALLYYLKLDRTMEIPIDRSEARSAVRAFIEGQEQLRFPMRPGGRCRRCAFFQNRCPAQLSAVDGF